MSKVLSDLSRSTDDDILSVPVGAARTEVGEKLASWRQRQQAILEVGRETVSPQDIHLFLQKTASLFSEALGKEHDISASVRSDSPSFQIRLNLSTSGGFSEQYYHCSMDARTEDVFLASALEAGHPIAVPDLMTDESRTDRFLTGYGIRGILAVPLCLADQSYGVLAACSVNVCRFDDDDMKFAETIGHLASTTIAHVMAEKAIETERHFMDRALESLGAVVLRLDSEGTILHANEACASVTGFSHHDILGRPIWDVFPVPKGVDLFPLIFRKLKEGKTPVEYEGILEGKDGPCRIAWSYVSIPSSDGSPGKIVTTGIDVTRRWEAERAIQEIESRLKNAPSHSLATSQESIEEDPVPPYEEKPIPAATTERAIQEIESRLKNALSHSLATSQESIEEDPAPPYREKPISTATAERRRHVRRLYPFKQVVAPIINDNLPPRHWFYEVECYDIAVGGFSFFYTSPPDFKRLVVGLGTTSNLTYLIAQVAHVTPVQHRGRSVYRVGCMYLGKAKY